MSFHCETKPRGQLPKFPELWSAKSRKNRELEVEKENPKEKYEIIILLHRHNKQRSIGAASEDCYPLGVLRSSSAASRDSLKECLATAHRPEICRPGFASLQHNPFRHTPHGTHTMRRVLTKRITQHA